MPDIEGYILVGGASSRMGTDKSLLTLGGETFTRRIARALGTVAGSVSVVSAREEHAGADWPLVRDLLPGKGALGGIHAALKACRAEWAAVVSCDLPFVTPELFARLASLRGHEHDAVAPTQPDGRPQPLCALYARATCAELARRLIEEGELRPRVMLSRLRTRWVEPRELEDLEGHELFFTNVNTPEDYARAKSSQQSAVSDQLDG